MATAKATTDRDQIQRWVEERGGHPARVKATGNRKDPGVLRIDFPGFSGEDTLEEIEWDEFFEWFNRNRLAILLSDEKGNRFNKLVSRSTASKKSGSKKSSSSKKASSGSKKAASSSKKSSGSSKKGGGSKKSSSSAKKASSSKKSSSKKSSSKKSSGGSKKSSKRK